MFGFCSKISMFCLALGMMLAGCGDIDSRSRKAIKRFGVAMDGKRTELKLLPIPKNARINLLTATSLSWISKDPNSCHVAKTIVFNPEITALVSEIDDLHSPGFNNASGGDDLVRNKKPEAEGSCLTIITRFAADGQGIDQQSYKLTQGKKTTSPAAQEVEKLLSAWGVR